MSTGESRQLKNFPDLAVFAALSLICSLAGMLCGVSGVNCLKFALYQIGVIYLPGNALCLFLTGKAERDAISRICLSCALGYTANVLAYFAVVLFGLTRVSALGTAGFLLVAGIIVTVIGKRKETQKASCEGMGFFLCIFAVFFIVVFFAYSARHALPGAGGSVAYHADALYWIENASALMHSFPPAELRMSGTILYYHYFASAYLAFAGLVTGIDVFSLGYALYPLGKCLILFGGLYELSGVFFKDRRKQAVFLLVLLFTTGLEKISIANYVAHIVSLPFGFDLGYAFGAYSLAFLSRQFFEKKFKWSSCALTALCFLMCAGHKAPVALIYLLFGGILCLYWLFKNEPVKAFANGALLLCAFFLVMFVCVGWLSGAESRVNAGSFSHVATLRASPLFDGYEEAALSRAPGLTGWAPVLALYCVLMLRLCLSIHPFLLLLEINGIVECIRKKQFDLLDGALLASIAFGLLMGLFNAQEGVSQLYYTLASYLPGLLFGLRHLEMNEGVRQRGVCVAAALLFCVQCTWFFGSAGAAKDVKAGLDAVAGKRLEVTGEEMPYSLQKQDYDALVWIRSNTEDDAVLAADRSILFDLDNYMFYGTFSERQMYLEGDRYFYGTYLEERAERRKTLRDLYLNEPGAREKCKDDGIDYVIQTKWITPDYQGEGCEKVFETDTIRIWKMVR